MSRISTMLLAIVAIGLIGTSSAFITGCATLGTPVNNEERCTTCQTGFVLANGGALCNICPLGCSSCDAQNNCQTCSAGTYLFQGQCLSCGVGCGNCNGATCVACASGFTLDNNKCIACIPSCDRCTRNGVCENCRENYRLTNNDQGQQQCIFNDERDASPGIIIWIFVLFIVCCCPFIFLCCFLFPPSSHEGVPSTGYVPIEQPRARVAEIPSRPVVTAPLVAVPVTTIPVNAGSFNVPMSNVPVASRRVPTNETRTTTSVIPGAYQQYGPGKGNTVLAPGAY